MTSQFPGSPRRGPAYRGGPEYDAMDQGRAERDHGSFVPGDLIEEQRNFRFPHLKEEPYGGAAVEQDGSQQRRSRHATPEIQSLRDGRSPGQRSGRHTPTFDGQASSSPVQRRTVSRISDSSEDRSTSSPSSARMSSRRHHPGKEASACSSPLTSSEQHSVRSLTPSVSGGHYPQQSSAYPSSSREDQRLRHHPEPRSSSSRGLRTFQPDTGGAPPGAPFQMGAELLQRYNRRRSSDSQGQGFDETGETPGDGNDSLSRTRSSQRRVEADNAPIAKRLRR